MICRMDLFSSASPCKAARDSLAPKGIIVDCFGVLYVDAFKVFLDTHAKDLQLYLLDMELDSKYPDYYFELAQKIDLKEISDQTFYDTLSKASKLPAHKIREFMHEKDSTFNEKVFLLLRSYKERMGCKLELIANADRDFIQEFLEHNKVGEIFDAVLTSSELNVPKTNPKFLAEGAHRLGLSFSELVYIDDSLNNVVKAKEIGIRAIQFIDEDQLNNQLQEIFSEKQVL